MLTEFSCLVLQIPSVQHLMVYMNVQEKSKSYYKILVLCVLCQTNALREYEPMCLVWICVYGDTPISRQLRALDYEHFALHFLGLQLSKPFMQGTTNAEGEHIYSQCYSSQNLYSHNIGHICLESVVCFQIHPKGI